MSPMISVLMSSSGRRKTRSSSRADHAEELAAFVDHEQAPDLMPVHQPRRLHHGRACTVAGFLVMISPAVSAVAMSRRTR